MNCHQSQQKTASTAAEEFQASTQCQPHPEPCEDDLNPLQQQALEQWMLENMDDSDEAVPMAAAVA